MLQNNLPESLSLLQFKLNPKIAALFIFES
jgi:hypothetical protein